MALITWSEDFAVNVREVDEQHQKLFALFNNLFDAMRRGKGKPMLGTVLNELIDYAVYHFNTEETLFRKYDYPGARQHKMEHETFKKKVADFKTAFDKGESLVTVELLNFLTKWLKNHIMVEDKKFGPFLKDRDCADPTAGK
jgi:hemerythrin